MNALPKYEPLVLLVEDELLIAASLEIILQAHNYRILGPVATVEAALALLQGERPDLALLDYRLARDTTASLLPTLAQQGIPVCVLSGYSRQQLPDAYNGCALLEKPFRTSTLLAALQAMDCQRVA